MSLAAATRVLFPTFGWSVAQFRPGRVPRRVVLLRRASPCRDGPLRGGRVIQGRIDPATGVFTSYDQAAEAAVECRPEVDPEVAAHEARHAAIALVHGVRVTEASADSRRPTRPAMSCSLRIPI